jgi:hypothetical protein
MLVRLVSALCALPQDTGAQRTADALQTLVASAPPGKGMEYLNAHVFTALCAGPWHGLAGGASGISRNT